MLDHHAEREDFVFVVLEGGLGVLRGSSGEEGLALGLTAMEGGVGWGGVGWGEVGRGGAVALGWRGSGCQSSLCR